MREFIRKSKNPYMVSALILVVAAMVMDFGYLFMKRGDYSKQAAAISLVSTTAEDLSTHLKSNNSSTTLYVYASWCKACKQVMPHMLEALKQNNGKHEILFVSIDHQPQALRYYLAESEADGLFTPWVLQPANPSALASSLAPFGSKFKGGIPYIAQFKNGQMTRDSVGVSMETIVADLKKDVLP